MRYPVIALVGWFALTLGSPRPHAQETKPMTLEERLERMENEIRNLRQENEELKRELGISGEGARKALVQPAGKESVLKIGGFIQAQADFGDRGDSRFGSRNDRFYIRRARLNASGTLLEDFDFKLELDLAGTLSESSSLRAQATDIYVQWTRFDEAGVRVGQFKSPYGFEQLYSDTLLYTIERTLPSDRLTWSRQIGVQVFGDLLDDRLSYAAGLFNGTGSNNGFNDSDNFLYAGRISGIPWRGSLLQQESSVRLGLNAYYSDDERVSGISSFGFDSTPNTPEIDNVFAGIRKGYGADLQFQLGPLELWTEYLRARFSPDNRLPSRDVDAEGWYVQGAYYLLPERLQAVVKFDSFDPDTDQRGNSTDTFTFGLNYYLRGHDLKFQVNYLLVDDPDIDHWQSKVLGRAQIMF